MHRELLDEAVVELNLAESNGDERANELKDNDHADEADGREVYVNVAQLATAYALGHGFAQHAVIGRGILRDDFHDVLAAGVLILAYVLGYVPSTEKSRAID